MRRLRLVLLAVVALLAIAAPAQAGCGDQIRDEFLQTGAVTGAYPQECYQDAIDNLPADVREYTDAEDVIRAAMARAATSGAAAAGTDAAAVSDDGAATTQVAAGAVGDDDGGDDGGVPAAVIVLLAVSLLLVALGIAGVLVRRARRA